jgi:EpsI family protein
MLLCFWPTLIGLPGTWSASYQEHGFFIGGLTMWLLWRDRHLLASVAGEGVPNLVPVLAVLSGVWLLAAIMNVRLIQQGLLAVILMGWAFAVFGWGARRLILGIGLTFLLAVPFWSFLVPVLQRATVIASGGATQLAGITAVIGYDYIQITTGTFLVEEGCAGLNYLMGGLVLGACYAHIFVDRWQTQLKIVLLAGAMSIVGNWIRVSALIFLGEATAMQSPYIEDHLWQGWAIFTALMLPTYLLARRIEIRDDASFGPHAPGDGDGDTDPAAELLDITRPHRAGTAALAVCAGPLAFMLVGAVPRGDEVETDVSVVGVVDEWSVSAPETPDPWRADFGGVDQEVAWTLSDGVDEVGATRQYFMDQTQGREMIGWPNAIAPDSMVVSDRVIGPVGPTRRFLHEAVIRTPEGARVVWYWYRVAGFDTPFESKAKLLEVLAFFGRSAASELVTVSAACGPNDCREAADVLRRAMGAPPLPPQDPPSSEPSAVPTVGA